MHNRGNFCRSTPLREADLHSAGGMLLQLPVLHCFFCPPYSPSPQRSPGSPQHQVATYAGYPTPCIQPLLCTSTIFEENCRQAGTTVVFIMLTASQLGPTCAQISQLTAQQSHLTEVFGSRCMATWSSSHHAMQPIPRAWLGSAPRSDKQHYGNFRSWEHEQICTSKNSNIRNTLTPEKVLSPAVLESTAAAPRSQKTSCTAASCPQHNQSHIVPMPLGSMHSVNTPIKKNLLPFCG